MSPTEPASLRERLARLSPERRALVEQLRGRAAAPGPAAVGPLPRDGGRTASPEQRQLWFLERFRAGGPLYTISTVVECAGTVDAEALTTAAAELARRHDVLRWCFPDEAGEPTVVVTDAPPPVRVRALAPGEAPGEAVAGLLADLGGPFDLATGPLWRMGLLTGAPDGARVVVLAHHIVVDGWSVDVLRRDLGRALAGTLGHHAPPPITFAEHVARRRDALQGARRAALSTFWRSTLAGAPAVLPLPCDRPRPAVPGGRGAVLGRTLPAATTTALTRTARTLATSELVVALTVFAEVLRRWTGTDDVVVGTAVAGREDEGIEDLVGLLVTTVPVRLPTAGPDVVGAIRDVHRRLHDVLEHRDLPLEDIVLLAAPHRSSAHAPLFQVVLLVEPDPGTPVRAETAGKFDLTLALRHGPAGTRVDLEYDGELFDPATADAVLTRFTALLTEATRPADGERRALADLARVPHEDARRLDPWRTTPDADDPTRMLVDRVRERARTDPDGPAVDAPGHRRTHAGLVADVDELAGRLAERGVGGGDVVALLCERGPAHLVALLALATVGATALLLDPDHPADRRAELVDTSEAVLVLTAPDPGTVELVPTRRAPVGRAGRPAPGDRAHIVHTSGSTGVPKGAIATHEGLAGLAESLVTALDPAPRRLLQIARPGFDASVFETVATLAVGATAVFADRPDIAPGPALAATLRDREVDAVVLTPSALAVTPHEDLDGLTLLVTAAEASSRALVERWSRPGRRVLNAYGPSECSVATLLGPCTPGRERALGTPVRGARLHLLDAAGRVAPPGAVAELWIAGPAVGPGYLGRPDLTDAAFHVRPELDEGLLYRTGDLVRLAADDGLDFVGRADDQISLRGLRIEPGEVEAALRTHPAVADAHVGLDRPARGGPRLVAHLLLAPGVPAPPVAAVRTHLSTRLPSAFVPALFVWLRSWPTGPTGKLDRSALPAPASSADGDDDRPDPPRDPVERTVATHWSTLLDVEVDDRDADFFALGGSSLSAPRVAAALTAALGVEVGVRQIFLHPTVATLAAALAPTLAAAGPPPIALSPGGPS